MSNDYAPGPKHAIYFITEERVFTRSYEICFWTSANYHDSPTWLDNDTILPFPPPPDYNFSSIVGLVFDNLFSLLLLLA